MHHSGYCDHLKNNHVFPSVETIKLQIIAHKWRVFDVLRCSQGKGHTISLPMQSANLCRIFQSNVFKATWFSADGAKKMSTTLWKLFIQWVGLSSFIGITLHGRWKAWEGNVPRIPSIELQMRFEGWKEHQSIPYVKSIMDLVIYHLERRVI